MDGNRPNRPVFFWSNKEKDAHQKNMIIQNRLSSHLDDISLQKRQSNKMFRSQAMRFRTRLPDMNGLLLGNGRGNLEWSVRNLFLSRAYSSLEETLNSHKTNSIIIDTHDKGEFAVSDRSEESPRVGNSSSDASLSNKYLERYTGTDTSVQYPRPKARKIFLSEDTPSLRPGSMPSHRELKMSVRIAGQGSRSSPRSSFRRSKSSLGHKPVLSINTLLTHEKLRYQLNQSRVADYINRLNSCGFSKTEVGAVSSENEEEMGGCGSSN